MSNRISFYRACDELIHVYRGRDFAGTLRMVYGGWQVEVGDNREKAQWLSDAKVAARKLVRQAS